MSFTALVCAIVLLFAVWAPFLAMQALRRDSRDQVPR